MATIKKNKILAKKSKPIGRYRLGGSPTDPPVGGSTPTDPPKAAMTAEEKAEAKAEAAAAAKKAEEARIAGLTNKQYRQEKRGVKRNVNLENEKAGKNEGRVTKAITAGVSAASGALGLAEGIKRLFKKEQKIGGIIKTKMKIGGTKTKAMYGTSVKPGMMKKGGIKKTLRKAQYGIADTTPGQMSMDAPMPTRPMSMVPSGRGKTISTGAPSRGQKSNIDRPEFGELTSPSSQGQFRKPEPTSEQDRRAAYGKKGIIVKKTGNMKTKTMYKTGGMVNPNAKLQAAKAAGSKGVMSGVNPKAAASNVAKKPSKPRSKAPKKAAPGRK
jgi:hypothetical protein